MTVKLLHYTPLHIAAGAIRTCWQSQNKSDTVLTPTGLIFSNCDVEYKEYVCGPNDRALIDRVGNKFKHASTLEHLSYNFEISDISRALLQEWSRHRIMSQSVQSTRYTLGKELKNATLSFDTCDQFLVLTGNESVDKASFEALCNLQQLVRDNISNDLLKYVMPESYKVQLTATINARSLQNFLSLRINHKHALWEIVQLAENIALSLPNDHKYLYKNIIEEFASPEFKEVFNKSMI